MSDFPLLETPAPSIETPRLILRQPRYDDFADLAAMNADPVAMKYLSASGLSEEESWMRFLRGVGQWHIFGFGTYVVTARDSGRFLGVAGLGFFKRQLEPSLPWPEMAYVFCAEGIGKGYGTEAGSAVLRWADAQASFEKTILLTAVKNTPSRKLAEKLGYRLIAEPDYKDQPHVLYERARGAAGRIAADAAGA